MEMLKVHDFETNLYKALPHNRTSTLPTNQGLKYSREKAIFEKFSSQEIFNRGPQRLMWSSFLVHRLIRIQA